MFFASRDIFLGTMPTKPLVIPHVLGPLQMNEEMEIKKGFLWYSMPRMARKKWMSRIWDM